ncbi:MAG TPA: CU044_2847 family protein [Blastocatellia bacterium]|nr:CU044_2847 family protein [Blastocatellia bacterium]
MKRIVEVPLEQGGTLLIEVDDPEIRTGIRSISPTEVAEQAKQTFESALEKIKPAASAIVDKLKSISDPPDQIGVEFGIKLSAKASAFIASSDAEANFKVSLTWKRNKAEGHEP